MLFNVLRPFNAFGKDLHIGDVVELANSPRIKLLVEQNFLLQCDDQGQAACVAEVPQARARTKKIEDPK